MELHANGSKEIPSIHTTAVPEVLRRAKEDLAHLLRERAEVMKRIGTVKQLIAGLANLFGDEILSDDLLVQLNRKGRVRPRVPAGTDAVAPAAVSQGSV